MRNTWFHAPVDQSYFESHTPHSSAANAQITPEGTIDFSAQHYTDRELWQVKYAHDLGNIRRSEVVLNLDCVQRGLGNASCGPGPRPKYEIKKDSVYTYAFRIEEVK